ncbi:hypothetical protein ACFVUQ_05605 [Streptomyces cyaneofuscatus]|uniref:hypothetical protein n=1 Tax=Streptomyces cyaneofuscatus TaxID=66883 RepID=UPI0036D7C263
MSIGIDAYQHWKAKAVRRPDDVTTTTPPTWQVEKYGEAERRLTGRYLPPSEVATALGGTPNEARAALRSYADEQRQRYEDDRMAGQNPTGLSPEQYRSVLGLAELADHERTSSPSGQQPDEPLT